MATNSKKISRPGQRRDESLVERAIAMACAGLAFGAVAIAAREVLGDQVPKINGLQHFAIFAQPSRYHADRVRMATRAKDIDFEPTASIDKAPRLTEYRLKWVERDRAVFDGPDGPFFAEVGRVIPGKGAIVAIVKKGREYELVFGPPVYSQK